MKLRKFEEPEVEITKLMVVDVITESGKPPLVDDDDNGLGWG